MANRNGNVMIVYNAVTDKHETIRNEDQNKNINNENNNSEIF
jgi:hypothetical protein